MELQRNGFDLNHPVNQATNPAGIAKKPGEPDRPARAACRFKMSFI
jgi:hypothetical protein